MKKKFEINRTKIKGTFQSGRKVVTYDSKMLIKDNRGIRQIALRIVGYHFSSRLKANRKRIKGGCHSGRKVVTYDSKSDLPLTN